MERLLINTKFLKVGVKPNNCCFVNLLNACCEIFFFGTVLVFSKSKVYQLLL